MIRHHAAALGILFVLTGFATQAQSQPTTTTSTASTQPVYSVTYRVPTVQDVTRTLDRIRERLDLGSPVRMVDSRSGEEITDFSKPGPAPAMDRGPELKFPPISYPMGVINSGMLLCAEATGDKKFSDFVAKRYQFYADHYADVEKWDQERGRSPFHPFYHPDSLDSCGSMGAAMVKAKRTRRWPGSFNDRQPLGGVCAQGAVSPGGWNPGAESSVREFALGRRHVHERAASGAVWQTHRKQ